MEAMLSAGLCERYGWWRVLRSARVRSGAMHASATQQATDAIWNFAYGANINETKLRAVRKMMPLDSQPCVLAGWRLAFNHNGGMGNLVRDPRAACHGVAHLLSADDFARLSAMENDYDATPVRVLPYDADSPAIDAVAFVSKPSHEIAEGLPPPTRYANLLREGAAHWKLEHAAWLDALATLDGQRGAEYRTSVRTGEPIRSTWRAARRRQNTGSRRQGR